MVLGYAAGNFNSEVKGVLMKQIAYWILMLAFAVVWILLFAKYGV